MLSIGVALPYVPPIRRGVPGPEGAAGRRYPSMGRATFGPLVAISCLT
jgi:hypothetical protein